jgi:hypothetical protein
MLVIRYSKGITEIKNISEEAKTVKRDEIIMKAVKESGASIVIDAREEKNKIVMRKDASAKLGIKEGGKVYLVNYGRRIFLFKEKEGGKKFIEELKKAGAAIGEENLRQQDGVYIKDETMIKKEDIEELGEMKPAAQ